MANRFYSPNQQFISNLGVPYAGGFLYFYASGTSTPLNTYSDSALTIANTNPVVLDSNGQAGSVFLQNLSYKVVLTDSNLNQIWTEDPVYTSDYSAFAKFLPWNGNPNGAVSGVAGTQGALPGSSVVWDYLDDILYVCTTTGTTTTAVWTAVNASAATPATPAPQGYLTLSSDSSNPILTADAVASTTVYYTPYKGSLVPIYNGSSFITTAFTQLILTLSASQALNNIYDVFVFNNSGVLTLVTGPAWNVNTSGSCSRGTGASTTQIQRLNGLWVNAVQISGRNGATTYTINANTATYLGSIFIDGTAGQVSCYRSWGQSRKWGVWNAYNRNPIYMQVGDSTTSWQTSAAFTTFRVANGNTANNCITFTGLPEEEIFSEYTCWMDAGATGRAGFTAVGVNSQIAAYGQVGNGLTASAGWFRGTITGTAVVPPALGINTFYALESSTTACNFNGTQTYCQMTTWYEG